MALTRADKEQVVTRYREGLAKASNAFLVDYKGIDVPGDTDLRAKIRESGGRYEVVKNRLALHAIEGNPLEALRDLFQGPVAVAYTEDEPVALAKALTEFAKEVPTLEFKGGLVEGRPVMAEDIEEIAKLPSRDELVAKLLYILQSPVTGLARVLSAVPRDFVVVLGQVAEKKQQNPDK